MLLLGTGMAEALMPYISLYHLIEQGKISAERIIEVLDAPVLPVLAPPQTPKDASVSFHHVHFRYPGRAEAFAMKEPPLESLVDGIGIGMGGQTTCTIVAEGLFAAVGIEGEGEFGFVTRTVGNPVGLMVFVIVVSGTAAVRIGLPTATDRCRHIRNG